MKHLFQREALKNLQLFTAEHLNRGGSGAFTSSASQTQLFVCSHTVQWCLADKGWGRDSTHPRYSGNSWLGSLEPLRLQKTLLKPNWIQMQALWGMEQKPTALPFPTCSLYWLISLLYLSRISSSELGWKAALTACQLCAQTPQLLWHRLF